jgi:hypothetical protein
MENITEGFSVAFSGVSNSAPVTLAEFKNFTKILFTDFDNELTLLIKAVWKRFEEIKCVSLVERTVEVSWIKMFDFEQLPYGPIRTAISEIVLTDGDGNEINSSAYKITGLGGNYRVTGCFPNGLKTSYTAGFTTIGQDIKQAIIMAVNDVFVNNIPVDEAIIKHSNLISL